VLHITNPFDKMADPNTITVRLTLTNVPHASHSITLGVPCTVGNLRDLVQSTTSIPLSSMRIIYRGKLISGDSKDTSSFGIEDGCVIHVLGRPATATGVESATESTAPTATVGAGPAVSIAAPSREGVAAASVTPPAGIRSAVRVLKSNNDAATSRGALKTLLTILDNVSNHPTEEKYRSMRRSNAAFGRKLGNLRGGEECLLACGFEVQEDKFVLIPSASKWEIMQECRVVVREAVAGLSSQTVAPVALATGAQAGVGGFGGAGTGGLGAGMGSSGMGMQGTGEMMRIMMQVFPVLVYFLCYDFTVA